MKAGQGIGLEPAAVTGHRDSTDGGGHTVDRRLEADTRDGLIANSQREAGAPAVGRVRGEARGARQGAALPSPVQGSGRSPELHEQTSKSRAPGAACTAAPSSLDTRDITRQPGDTCVQNATPNAWLDEVGRLTEHHRKKRAREFHDKGLARMRDSLAAGYSPAYARDRSRWHKSRAQGQRDRIENVLDCGAESVHIECQSCGRSHERTQGCRCALLCVRCRGRIASEKRAQFLRARSVVLENAAQRGLLNERRRGGRWSEKLLTVTAPHLPGESIPLRIERVQRGWTIFLRLLNAHLQSRGAARSTRWHRTFEWTPAADGNGHPHFHVWLFCPWIDRELVLDWWRQALIDARYAHEAVRTLIIDLRALDGSPQSAQEVIKYLTKDIDANGQKIPPAQYAEVYMALDGSRVTQGSSGFLALAKRETQCECGSPLPRRVRIVRKKSEPAATEKGETP